VVIWANVLRILPDIHALIFSNQLRIPLVSTFVNTRPFPISTKGATRPNPWSAGNSPEEKNHSNKIKNLSPRPLKKRRFQKPPAQDVFVGPFDPTSFAKFHNRNITDSIARIISVPYKNADFRHTYQDTVFLPLSIQHQILQRLKSTSTKCQMWITFLTILVMRQAIALHIAGEGIERD